MQLKVISPERQLLDLPVELVELPGTGGRFQVLHNHAPLVTSLRSGVISYVPAGSASDRQSRPFLKVSGGFAEVLHNVITVCVE